MFLPENTVLSQDIFLQLKLLKKMEDVLYDANSSDSYVISTKYITVNNSYVSLKNDMHFVNKTW